MKDHADDRQPTSRWPNLFRDAARGARPSKVLEEPDRFPARKKQLDSRSSSAPCRQQKRFAEAEAAFQRVLARSPTTRRAELPRLHAPERASGSTSRVTYSRRPRYGAGPTARISIASWAYYKANKLDLAETNLKTRRDQLRSNSVIQDHYGDVLFKLRRLHTTRSRPDATLAATASRSIASRSTRKSARQEALQENETGGVWRPFCRPPADCR